MRISSKATCLSIIILFFALACKKETANPDESLRPIPEDMQGSLYYEFANDGLARLDVRSGGKTLFLSDDVQINQWDLNQDGSLVLTASDVNGNADVSRYTLFDAKTQEIKHQFDYPSGLTTGLLSPDEKLVLIEPTFEAGVVLVNLQGQGLHHLLGIGSEKFQWHTGVCWLPGNGILIAHKKALYEIRAPYQEARLLREMPYEDWDLLAVSPGGDKVVVRIGNHLHMMQGEGSDLIQITESNSKESEASFSPNGKYLLIGTDHTVTGPFGSYFRLKIIPADGKKYQVDPLEPNSPEAIPVIPTGSDEIEPASGRILWR